MNRTIKFFGIMLPLVLLYSCSGFDVMKRRYTDGFYVHHSAKQKKDDHKSAEHSTQKTESSAVEENKTAATQEQITAGQNSFAEQQVDAKVTETRHSKKIMKKEKGELKDDLRESVVFVDSEISDKEIQRQLNYSADGAADDTVMFVLLLILSFVLPPLAVYLKQETTGKWFWITLVLCLLSWIGIYSNFLFSLWFVAAICALLVVLDILR